MIIKGSKGQFYLITSIFVFISLAVIFTFALFINFGIFSLPTQNMDFTNLQNAIRQQNNWLQENWYNVNWKNRLLVNITGGALTPATITNVGDSSINCTKEIKVLNRSASGNFLLVYAEVNASNANGAGPCNVMFNASLGLYQIYYNNSAANENNPSGIPNEITSYSEDLQKVPQNVCAYFSQILPKKNIAFNCSATASNNFYNYSIDFKTTEFTYSGSLV
jgi:hypothetical protein